MSQSGSGAYLYIKIMAGVYLYWYIDIGPEKCSSPTTGTWKWTRALCVPVYNSEVSAVYWPSIPWKGISWSNLFALTRWYRTSKADLIRHVHQPSDSSFNLWTLTPFFFSLNGAHITHVWSAGWGLLLYGARCGGPCHLVVLLPARSPAFLVLLRWRMRDHPGNVEISGVGWILRTQDEAHRGAARVCDQTTHRRLRCEIDSTWLIISVWICQAPNASPSSLWYDRSPVIEITQSLILILFL